MYLLIDSDLQQGEEKKLKQQQRVDSFIARKYQADGYVLKKSCIENYYHPRAIERVFANIGIAPNTFEVFEDNVNVKKFFRDFVEQNNLEGKNLKYKNNHQIFQETTKNEWSQILESELIEFLDKLINS